MSDIVAGVLATEGLWVLIFGATIAGLVRGFSGFGTAMVFLPIAGQVVPPVWALTIMGVMDMIGPLPLIPRALRDGHPRDILRLVAGLILAMPLGILLLSFMTGDVYRYAVSLITLILLAALMAGLRYRGVLNKPLVFGTGAIGGFLTGAVGLAGPPVIMLYMASTHAAAAIRANLLLYLFCADLLLVMVFGASGMITLTPVLLGLVVAVPYLLANVAGAAIFDPNKETLYRRAAYVIIALSAITGLPLWD